MRDVTFEAPGAGSWTLDATHFQRPMSRFAFESFRAGMVRGFAEGTARYGLLLDHMEPAAVNGFVYMREAVFGADGSATPDQFEQRLLTAARAFDERRWRDDLRRWDEEDRPAAVAEHRRIQAVDPSALGDEELAGHLGRCRAHVEASHYLHHKYTAASTIVTGDFLAPAMQWTGLPPGELMELVRGSTPISVGFAAAEQEAAAVAIRDSEPAGEVLASAALPDELLDGLVSDPVAGPAVAAYLDAVRYRSVGYDVGDATAGEMPEMLVAALRAAVDGAAATPLDEARLARVRSRVPAEHLADFDDRLAEARLVNRLRDERGTYSDGWGTGLARRAVLEAGRRLYGSGALAAPEHAVDADADELAALLLGADGPGADEVAERFRWRISHTTEDAPPWLGDQPEPPPPPEALPVPSRRGMAAAGVAMMNLFGVPDVPNSDTVLYGLPVNDGVYEGRARVVNDAADFSTVRSGDVLVARMTSPYFTVVLPLLGAIVTDRGGQLSHPAIVAREYGIPGIVGTREATRRIPDGSRVRVDGRTGEVRLLG